MIARITVLSAIFAFMAGVGASAAGGAAKPDVWMMPSPWPGNGQCLRELVAQDKEWVNTRAAVVGLGYWPSLLNVHFSDDQIRSVFAKVHEWGLKFAFEVPVVKPENPTANDTFNLLQKQMERFVPLGAKVDQFAFDEPLYATRYMMGKTEEYAVTETADYISRLRKAYPNAQVGDIEPYPAMKLAETTHFVDALQAKCAQDGNPGIDFLRLDVDWADMGITLVGSWAEIKKLEEYCRSKGIKFSMIYWAADNDLLADKGLGSDMNWYMGVMHHAAAYALAGGKPDQYVIESWVHAPEHAVPETKLTTFTRSVLDFCTRFVPKPGK
jgi:hypothetical protein